MSLYEDTDLATLELAAARGDYQIIIDVNDPSLPRDLEARKAILLRVRKALEGVVLNAIGKERNQPGTPMQLMIGVLDSVHELADRQAKLLPTN